MSMMFKFPYMKRFKTISWYLWRTYPNIEFDEIGAGKGILSGASSFRC